MPSPDETLHVEKVGYVNSKRMSCCSHRDCFWSDTPDAHDWAPAGGWKKHHLNIAIPEPEILSQELRPDESPMLEDEPELVAAVVGGGDDD